MRSSPQSLSGLIPFIRSYRVQVASAGEVGQTVVYVVLLASVFSVLGEVYGDVLRAAGATERLMELPTHPIGCAVARAASACAMAHTGVELGAASGEFQLPVATLPLRAQWPNG